MTDGERIADALRGTSAMGGHYAVSSAIYDIAQAINDKAPPDYEALGNCILAAGEMIRDGLTEVAKAIRVATEI